MPTARRNRKLAAVSMFSGCGGLDLGASETGLVQPVWGNDTDRWACETYRRNIGRHIEGDICEIDPPSAECDILLAGPPCQDFSTLWNHDGARTARGNLFREVARFLDALQPAGFVLENVPGLLSANRGAAWTIVRHALRAPSAFLYNRPGPRYDLSAQVIDMADLGVPQHRERLIVMGTRRDLAARPPLIPSPTEDHPRNGPRRTRRAPDPRRRAQPRARPRHHRGGRAPEAHPPGRNYEVIPDGHPLAVKGLISHVYRRLEPDKPSYTVIANGGGGTHGYHHVEPRRLSNRERARLQTFPDDFVLYDGGASAGRSAYPRVRRQIGNAVPPEAGRVIVDALARTLLAAGVDGHGARALAKIRREALSLGLPINMEASEAA